MTTATFRFYAELNDFLAPQHRQSEFVSTCAQAATVKHMIEALGVPHTEVELILINGESSTFDRLLRDGDRVAVYPTFEALDITPVLRVREQPLRCTRFIADAHLGGLARLLRLTGFDTLYDNNFEDREIEAIAARDGRIVLTRDRELLKQRTITHGCYVRALKPRQQLDEIFNRLELCASARPFTLCLDCNLPLRAIDRSLVEGRVPAGVFERQRRFSTCDGCGRVFWEGSHWQCMQTLITEVLGAPGRETLNDERACRTAGWRNGQMAECASLLWLAVTRPARTLAPQGRDHQPPRSDQFSEHELRQRR